MFGKMECSTKPGGERNQLAMFQVLNAKRAVMVQNGACYMTQTSRSCCKTNLPFIIIFFCWQMRELKLGSRIVLLEEWGGVVYAYLQFDFPSSRSILSKVCSVKKTSILLPLCWRNKQAEHTVPQAQLAVISNSCGTSQLKGLGWYSLAPPEKMDAWNL